MVTSQAELPAPIGGFFELHQPDGSEAGPSVLDAWTGGRPYAAFVNARSAFAALAAALPDASVWLPAFLCHDLVDPAFAGRTRFYAVLDGFEPDLTRVEAEARPGDLVLVAAYFGLPIGRGARELGQRRSDLLIVEDRAQALDAGPASGWTLYSPRKLLGVADGGLLVAPDARTALPQPTAAADGLALWRAPLMRREDPLGANNAAWHRANQAKEAAMAVTALAMTPRSLSILARASITRLAERRLANWRALDRRLRRWSALPADPGSPPLGYVLRLEPEGRDRLLRGLHADRIFAAVHWPAIAAPAEAFPREARWTLELVTLPCDHRYGDADMDRVASRVADLLR